MREFSKWTVCKYRDFQCTDGWYRRNTLYKIISNIDTNIRVCFLTGYDITDSDYSDLTRTKTKSIPNKASLFDTIVRNNQYASE